MDKVPLGLSPQTLKSTFILEAYCVIAYIDDWTFLQMQDLMCS